MKNWKSKWKWELIKEENPQLKDLSKDWYDKDQLKENML